MHSCSISGYDSDLYAHFRGDSTLKSFVKVCPGCGFTGRTDEFGFHSEEERSDSYYREKEQGSMDCATQFLGDEDEDLTAYRKFTALAERLVAENAAPELVGDAYLCVSYCIRWDNSNQFPMLRKKALSALLRAADLPQARRKTMYLCAELLRLCGRCDEASDRLRAFLALPVDDEQSPDLREFAAVLLKKSMRGNSRDVEFRWDEAGNLKWAEWTLKGREAIKKKREKDATKKAKSLLKRYPRSEPVKDGDGGLKEL